MAHRVTPIDDLCFLQNCDHFLAAICGDAINAKAFKHVELIKFTTELNSDSVNDKVDQLYFREMVDHDYSYNRIFYQFMLRLMDCGHLKAGTVFDVLIRPPGKIAPLLHSKIEMVPSQVFHDWCHYSYIEKRIVEGLSQEEIGLIKSHNFEQILGNHLATYPRAFEKFEKIFPATPSYQNHEKLCNPDSDTLKKIFRDPSTQINLEHIRRSSRGIVLDQKTILHWLKENGFIPPTD